MREQSSNGVHLAIMVISVAAFLSLAFGVVLVGRNFLSSNLDSMEISQEKVKIGSLQTFSGDIIDIPVAAVYSVVEGIGSELIDEEESSLQVRAHLQNGAHANESISKLNGRCKLEVVRLDTGMYKIKLHCTCCKIGTKNLSGNTMSCSCGAN